MPGDRQNHQNYQDPGESERLKAEIEQLRSENARRREELERSQERYLRQLADFENYRRRMKQERKTAAASGKRRLLSALLEFQDDFERALAHLDEPQASIAEGLRAIRRRLAGLLETEGVTSFESVGRPFDPTQHDAVSAVESEDQKPGTVIEELSRGYRWDQELLRPARVRVARKSG